MIAETALCIAIWLPTAWGLAPDRKCVLDCNVTHIYHRLVIEDPLGTCERTVLGDAKDIYGAFPVVYVPEDGTWHWLREQHPEMCPEEAKPMRTP